MFTKSIYLIIFALLFLVGNILTRERGSERQAKRNHNPEIEYPPPPCHDEPEGQACKDKCNKNMRDPDCQDFCRNNREEKVCKKGK